MKKCFNFGGEEGTNGEGYDFACSLCGICCDTVDPNYCPNCGAKVVEKEEAMTDDVQKAEELLIKLMKNAYKQAKKKLANDYPNVVEISTYPSFTDETTDEDEKVRKFSMTFLLS